MINVNMAVATLECALFLGWFIGILLWVLRFLFLELPRTGSIFMRKGVSE